MVKYGSYMVNDDLSEDRIDLDSFLWLFSTCGGFQSHGGRPFFIIQSFDHSTMAVYWKIWSGEDWEWLEKCPWSLFYWLVVWLPSIFYGSMVILYCYSYIYIYILVGGLVAIWIIFPEILGIYNHPNWRSHIFQRGGYTGPPTSLSSSAGKKHVVSDGSMDQ